MRLTVGELLNEVGEAFGPLIEMKLPIATSVKLRKMNKVVGEQIEIHIAERNKIFGQHKVPIDGNKYVFADMKEKEIVAMNADLKTLFDIEVELGCDPISVADLGDISIEPSVLIKLEKFIKD